LAGLHLVHVNSYKWTIPEWRRRLVLCTHCSLPYDFYSPYDSIVLHCYCYCYCYCHCRLDRFGPILAFTQYPARIEKAKVVFGIDAQATNKYKLKVYDCKEDEVVRMSSSHAVGKVAYFPDDMRPPLRPYVGEKEVPYKPIRKRVYKVIDHKWVGTAPFCGAEPKDCKKLGKGWRYLRSSDSADGKEKTCWTGTKVLCEKGKWVLGSPDRI